MARIERKNDEIRKIKFTRDVMENAYSSIMAESGKTKVLCTASISESLPDFIKENTKGWLSAEYNMLPGSTLTRKSRSGIKPDSRGIEIQRLIARSLRQAVNLEKMKNLSIIIDCDVIQADGGTRTASINGGYLALVMAVNRMMAEGILIENPLTGLIGAVSAGIVDDEILLDLDYSEDSRAQSDFNIVMNGSLRLIEIQGTAEKADFSIEQLNTLVKYCQSGIGLIFNEMKGIIN